MRKILLFLVLSLFLVSNVSAATGWVKGKPAGSLNPGQIDDAIGENNAALDLMLATYQNCKISYTSATTISVGAGGVMVGDVSGAIRLMLLNSSATSVTFADLDTGAEASSTTYYVWALASATTDTTFTCKISTSSSAPTGATYYKLLGSFYNDSSSNIVAGSITTEGAAPNISVATGTIANGATIPLPDGYTQDQCKWQVGLGTFNYGDDQHATQYQLLVSVNSSRVVTSTYKGSDAGAANYIIIGIK
jgi:hypothetical protein